jgi:hypothetical protein
MSALKRLAGAKEVSQDDFSQGVGTYIVKFDAPPALTMAAIKKETGNYSINGVELKLTTRVTQKKEDYYAGIIQLVKGTPEDAFAKLEELVKAKKTILVISGALEEDQKGKQSLKLSSVGEPDKAKK